MGEQRSFDFNSTTSQSERAFSVSSLNQLIKSKLESGLQNIWLKGEISNFKAHSSGHFYFSLKDEQSQINAVMFRGANSRLSFRPKDGLEVLVRGKISVYSPRGSYQILCEKMEAVGRGGLKEEFEALKRKLKSEGLFDSDQKTSLPFLPFHVALVTSPTSAAVRDMLQVLKRRHPAVKITVVPCLTQGDRAASDIVRALDLAEKLQGVEVILLARGGGSLEDMWCFNDEALARKIFSMKTPVISGVGHEIDFTIADFVSDLRAPTPSAAAELVCKNVEEVKEKIHQSQQRLQYRLQSLLQTLKKDIVHLTRRLVDPRRRLVDIRLKVDDLLVRAEKSLESKILNQIQGLKNLKTRLLLQFKDFSVEQQNLNFLKDKLQKTQSQNIAYKRQRLEQKVKIMEALNPYGVLDRGYSIVKNKKGEIIRSAQSISEQEKLNLVFAQGKAEVEVKKKIEDGKDD